MRKPLDGRRRGMRPQDNQADTMGNKRIDGTASADTVVAHIALMERISDRTRDDYSQKLETIRRHLAREAGDQNIQLTPARLSAFLIQTVRDQRFARATIRTHKAAAAFWLAEQAQRAIDSDQATLPEIEEAFQAVRAVREQDLPVTTVRTSARKLKEFPEATLQAVIDYNRSFSARSPHSGTLVSFLRANLLVGLRPVEWFRTSFVSYLHRDHDGAFRLENGRTIARTPALLVDNAKVSHARGNGPSREILLERITPEQLTVLFHFHELVSQFAAKYPADTPARVLAKKFFNPLQTALRRILRKRDGVAGATLYSTRHQVVANAKQSKLASGEIAALFGHHSKRTAGRHYAKQQAGSGVMTFRASPESVAAVDSKRPAVNNALPSPSARRLADEWLSSPGGAAAGGT